MVWVTLVWRFLSAIKPQTWLWLLFLAAVIAAVAYSHRHGTMTERAKQEARIATILRKGKEAIAEKDRLNAIAQATAFAKGQAAGESRVRDQKDIIASKDRLIADLGTGNRKLRDLWQGCVSGPQVGDAAALSGGPVPADELRREIAEQISEGFDADSRIARLIEFQGVLRTQAQQACGVDSRAGGR